ncbi:MAG: carboxypeptidase regulatory-like domain-containing protein [Acidobacteria bacterium]|nr:carboxypeptidase regulatory-like domain-containing protein [Acidobacteriota bacterium]
MKLASILGFRGASLGALTLLLGDNAHMVRLGVFIIFTTFVALGQSPTATITGIVRDSQGAVIPGVQVTGTSVATQQKTVYTTNESGLFSLRQLSIGEYVVEAEKPGFRRFVRRDLILTTGQSLELDIPLEVGELSESVTVSGTAPILETRSSDVAQLVEAKAVEDLPLGDRRSLNLIQMTGAAVFIGYNSGQKPNFSLAGSRQQSQMFWIDGGTGQNMRLGIGQVDLDPPVETVAEVKIMANSYAAEYGGSNGGVIVATTKSGTNELHGSLFEYLRNEKLDAANFFAPIQDGKKQRAPLRYNVFGGAVGGPVVFPKLYHGKDKTFFFFAYEGSRRRDGAISTLTVPTALERAGDFSQSRNAAGAVIPIYDPDSTQNVGGRFTRTQFPGNRIPSARIDPVAAKVASFYPLPNRTPDSLAGANNFRSNFVNGVTRNNYTAKVDHNFGSKDRLSSRYLYNSDDTSRTSVFPERGADPQNIGVFHQNYFYGNWTRTISTSIVNDFRMTYSNRVAHGQSQGLGQPWATTLGLRGVPDGAFPQFAAAGYTALGSSNQERRQFPIEQFQVVNNLSWVRGKHSFKFGAEIRPSFNFEVNRSTVSGAFGFSPLGTGQPGTAASGNGLATMLLGFVTGFSSRETEVLDRSSWYLAGFAQDDWSVNRDLTLNIGVRWETDTPMTDRNDRGNSFDTTQINPVSGTPGVVKFLGVNGWRTSLYSPDWNNFGPRFGFAWKPFGSQKSVLRGAYGVAFAHPFDVGVPASVSLGHEKSATLDTPDNGITAAFFLRNGVSVNLQTPTLNDSFGAVQVGQQPTTAVTFFETDRRAGYSHMFNFGYQRELGKGFIGEISFLGNLSHKLSSGNLSLNQVTPERLAQVAGAGRTPGQADRPFPQFSNVNIQSPTLGDSRYYAGVARIERRFAGGFSVLGTYTWARAFNNYNDGGSLGADIGFSNFYNRRADWGPTGNDVRHRLTMTSVYDIPVGKGKRFLSNNWLGAVVGNWTLGGLLTLQSGEPFTVNTQVNNTFVFSAGAQRADVLRDPNLPNSERTLSRWFDTSAFAQPAPFTFGNQGVNILRADGLINLDMSILRNFPVGEGRKFQLRGEFFNITNHPNFGGPGATLNGPGFGIVSSAGPGRRIQLGARFVF